jgi:O-antigen ligase
MKLLQRIALFLFFFSINFEMWDPFYTGGHFSISKLTGFFYLVVMIPSILKYSTPKEFKPILRPILYFFILLTIVSIFNIKTGYFDIFDVTILQNIILFWILLNHERIDNLILEKALLGFALGSVVLGFLFSMEIGIDFDAVSNRYSIFGDNSNNVGIRMCISLIIIPLIIIQNRINIGKVRFLFLLGIPLIFNAMIATGSRVSFLAFLLSFIAYMVLFKSKSKWGKYAVMFIGVFILIYMWQVLLKSQVIIERIIQSFQEGDLSERDIVWKSVMPIWAENPIFGVGKTGYEYITLNLIGRIISPHNVFLEVLCLTGIAGLFLYLVFLYRIIHKSYLTFRETGYLLSALLLIPVFGLLMSAQLLQVKIGWVIFAYILANSMYLTKFSAIQNYSDA